jgi:anti-sigma factor RsiW
MALPFDLEEIAEAYVMGTLNAADAEAFEEHYFVCANCATMIHRVAMYVDAKRSAARKLWPEEPHQAPARSL